MLYQPKVVYETLYTPSLAASCKLLVVVSKFSLVFFLSLMWPSYLIFDQLYLSFSSKLEECLYLYNLTYGLAWSTVVRSRLELYEYFFIFYLTAPRPTLCHSRERTLTSSMLIPAFVAYSTRRSPEASQQSWISKLAKHLVGFESGSFWFWK